MTKFATFAATATLASVAITRAIAEDNCVIVDFTAEESQFADLNAAIDLVISTSVVDSMLGKYDPLVLSDIKLGDFKYSFLGQDLTIMPTIDSMNITGLSTIALQHVNVTSSNCADFGAYSEGQVSVDAIVTATIKELDASATIKVALEMEKPKLATNVEANFYACAPGVSASLCSNMTVMGIETELVSAAVGGSYESILKEVLMKFKDASVKSVTLDFSSVSTFDISFDSSSSAISSMSGLFSDYTADEINKKGNAYDTVVSSINDEVPGLLNDLIESKLKPLFGATCLSEK